MEAQSFDMYVATVGIKAESDAMEKIQRGMRSKRGR